MADREGIEFTGRNTAEVRSWVNADPGLGPSETWFITRSMTNPISPQSWNYVRGTEDWGGDVLAAVYDPRAGEWRPVRKGDRIVRQGSGYGVEAVTS